MPIESLPEVQRNAFVLIGLRPFLSRPIPDARAGVFDVVQVLPNGQSADTSNVFNVAIGDPGGPAGLPVIDVFGSGVLSGKQGRIYGDNLFVEFVDPTTKPEDIAEVLAKTYIVKSKGASMIQRVAKFSDIAVSRLWMRSTEGGGGTPAELNRAQIGDPRPGATLAPEGVLDFDIAGDKLYLGFLSALTLTAGVKIRWGFRRSWVALLTGDKVLTGESATDCGGGFPDGTESAKANSMAQTAIDASRK